ncbi:MAG: hypothetical protein H6834_10090 [Planctomycetes bacterium]|nr:hypothetical protein [Planctomycetota bacterium]
MSPRIVFEGVRVHGNAGTMGTLDGVVEPGEHAAWSGPALDVVLRAVLGMEPLAAGGIWVDEDVVSAMGYAALREHRVRSAYVFPRGSLSVNATIADNVALPLRYHARFGSREIDRRVDEMLERFALEDVRDALPAQCDEETQQMAGFARALVTRPSLLLFEAVGADLSEASRDRARTALRTWRDDARPTILQWNASERFDVFAPDRMLSTS